MDRDRWHVLEPLLDRVLDLPDEDRDTWLNDLRQSSPDLAEELVALLSDEADANRRGFLSTPLDITLEGLVLGPYTLAHQLGQGGMGSVWLARRTDGRFEGQAAVKLLNLARLSPTSQARFRREGSVLARLAHPGIARLIDAGMTPNGQPYLVLEYIDGDPIDAYAASHHLAIEVRLALMLQVTDAVSHAHANLIVHRDLKPSNILVTGDGTVKLLDFGIAKLLDAKGLTVEGARVLTPEFAAPEQATSDTVTTATDVYALGVLLYLLLSGKHPTAEGCQTPLEILRALHDRQPAPLKLGDLGTIVDKALRKDPGDRYQTVAALADDLRRYLRQEPVSARRTSVRYRAGKFVRRHRVGVAVTMATILALVGTTVFAIAQMENARRQRDAAVFAGKRADAQVEFQSLLMSQLGDTPLTMREIVDRSRTVLEKQYAGDPRFLPTILIQLSERYADLGDSKIRGGLLARAESIATPAQLPEIRCHQADNLRTEGRYQDGWRVLATADSGLRAHPDPEAEALCLDVRASLAMESGFGKPEESLAEIRQAIGIRDRLGKTSDAFYIDLWSTLAEALDQQHRYREAIATYQRVDSLMTASGRGTTMGSAINEHDMAMTLVRVGETADAERLLHDVLVRARASDPTGRLPQQALIHYGHVALFQGDLDSAAKYFAMLDAEALADHNQYWQGRAEFGLAETQIQLGKLDDARRTMARFAPLSPDEMFTRTDDEITSSSLLDARWSASAGQRDSALQHVTDGLRAAGYFAGHHRVIDYSALILAAELSIDLGKRDAALQYARDAKMLVTRDSLTTTRSAFVGEVGLVEARVSSDTVLRDQARAALRAGAGSASALIEHRVMQQ